MILECAPDQKMPIPPRGNLGFAESIAFSTSPTAIDVHDAAARLSTVGAERTACEPRAPLLGSGTQAKAAAAAGVEADDAGVPARGSSRDLLGATDPVRPRSASTRRRSAPRWAVRAPLRPDTRHSTSAMLGLRGRELARAEQLPPPRPLPTKPPQSASSAK
jgi:hypothetical protein